MVLAPLGQLAFHPSHQSAPPCAQRTPPMHTCARTILLRRQCIITRSLAVATMAKKKHNCIWNFSLRFSSPRQQILKTKSDECFCTRRAFRHLRIRAYCVTPRNLIPHINCLTKFPILSYTQKCSRESETKENSFWKSFCNWYIKLEKENRITVVCTLQIRCENSNTFFHSLNE